MSYTLGQPAINLGSYRAFRQGYSDSREQSVKTKYQLFTMKLLAVFISKNDF